MKGLGSALWFSRYSMIASLSWVTLLKASRRMRFRVISAKKRSTMLSQDAEVGVKWRWKRGCRLTRRQVLRLAAMVTASAVSPKALSAAETLTGDADNADVPADGVPIFESVWQTVRDRFYDPRHNGLDWSAARERYLPDVQRATSQSSLASV